MSAPPFDDLVRAHATRLTRYLLAAVGPNDAGDCFQETVLAALRGYPPRHAENLRGWLFTIAHRQVIALARRRVPIPVAEPAELVELPELPAVPDPDLWAAVDRLPSKQRHAVQLRFAADLPYAAIGAALGTTEAAARQNVRAGLARLREECSDDD